MNTLTSKENSTNSQDDWKLGGDTDVHNDPLLDCIVLLAKVHGRPVSRNVVRAGLPLVNNLLSVQLFARAAKRAGLSSRVLRQPLSTVNPLTLPAILLLEGHRACVLTAIEPESGMLTVVFPETGLGDEKISREEIDKIYSGFAIFVRPEFRINNQNVETVQADRPQNWFWGGHVFLMAHIPGRSDRLPSYKYLRAGHPFLYPERL